MPPSITLMLYVVGAAWIMLWAFIRARGSNKSEWRQSDWVLPARIVYALGYVISFSGLTGLLVFGGKFSANLMEEIANKSPWLNDVISVIGEDQAAFIAPLFSIAALFIGLKLKPIADLDQKALAWLQNAEHFRDEVEKIHVALISRRFEPSKEEIQKNRAKLQEFDVRITDNRLISSDDELVTLWRKAACLLRMLELWQKSDPSILTAEELDELREIEETDKRKTLHAVDIVRALQASKQSARQSTATALAQRAPAHEQRLVGSGLVGAASVPDLAPINPQPSNSGIENRVEPYSLMISSEDFAAALKSIQHYFIKEYDLIVDRLSFLTAKHIVYASHGAEAKWESLKNARFEDFGELTRLSIDKIIKFFFASNLIILSLSFVLFAFHIGTGPAPEMIFKMSLAFSFAVLSGAMIGSNRALARRPTVPWAAIVGAGVASFLMFVFVFSSFAVATGFYDVALSESREARASVGELFFGRIGVAGKIHNAEFRDVLPWSIPIIVTAVSIARISRIHWPRHLSKFKQSLLDGGAMSGVLVATITVTLGLHARLETIPSRLFVVDGEIQFMRMGMPFGFFGILGFLVGLVVIRDVREIAASRA